ncbi:hypothetical protein BGX31_000298 [Mortierella sp. GBA43]|nr:hypothetical protein BGX31_000298 [Mortierella sp. GBA43]
MFPRLAGTRPALALKASLRYQAQLRSAVPASAMASIRHQSSSSSSRDNENQDSDKVDPVQSTAPHVNASFELHRIDLAHGSFFAMHRPLLGITNGPMFGNTSTNNTASAGNDTEQSTLNTTTDILTPSGNGSGVQNTTAMNEGDFEGK